MQDTKQNLTVNVLPSPTWNHLNVNKVELVDVSISETGKITENEIPENVTKQEKKFENGSFKNGAAKITENFPYNYYSVDGKSDKPLRLDIKLESGKSHGIYINAKKDSEILVIENFISESSGDALVHTVINLGEGAKLHLVQLQKSEDEFNFVNSIEISQSDNSFFEISEIVFGGKKTCIETVSEMSGNKSAFKGNIAYVQEKDENLDINFVVNQIGKKTSSEINVNGVLKDNAKKTFRGTIDFKKGSSGSTGSEKEDVMMMSETVENKTVPVILCHEEDVEGQHGATIGRLDDATLFYMESRGIAEEDVYKIMASAKIHEIASNIPDEKTLEKISEYLGEGAIDDQ